MALRGILEREQDAFARALTVKLLTYALGRGLTPADRQTVRTIARALPAHDYRFSGLVLEIVRSAPFQMRRGTTVMIVTGRHLPRRLFLKGLGAAIALPALDAMTPAFAAPASRTSPLRLAFTYVPNGVTLPDWTPAETGRGFTCSRILAPLAPYRDDTLVLTGLAHKNAYALGDGPGDHARAAAAYLTGVHARKTAGADIQNGISVDQIAAAHIGNDTRFRSIELGCDDSRSVGNCDSGYSCAYTNSVSWRSPTSPMPPEDQPAARFRAAVRRVRRRARPGDPGPADVLPPQHPRHGLGAHPRAGRSISARPTGARWTNTSPRSARSSGASSSPSRTCATSRPASRRRAACRCCSRIT